MAAEKDKTVSGSRRAKEFLATLGLVARATSGVATIAEGLHHSIHRQLGLGRKTGEMKGISGLAYQTVRQISHYLEKGARAGYSPAGVSSLPQITQVGQGKSLKSLAVLNGVVGDSLAETEHPFAMPMSFHACKNQGELSDSDGVKTAPKKWVLFIHGLCHSDQSWFESPALVSPHAHALKVKRGYRPLFLRYNTGRHISQNGRELAVKLDALLGDPSNTVEELAIVAHSMGGLLARSACHYAEQQGLAWRSRLKQLVFLGTPHQGAPLARAGTLVDHLLTLSSFSKPFLKLTQMRSAGIQDLRFGNIVDEDWQESASSGHTLDSRHPHQLPVGVDCFTVAGTKSPEPLSSVRVLLGDGLVPVSSALGQHTLEKRRLDFSPESQRVFASMDHNALLKSPSVTEQLCQWFYS